MNLTSIDWIIMLVYFAFVLGIGFVLKRRVKTSTGWDSISACRLAVYSLSSDCRSRFTAFLERAASTSAH